jgi:dihydrofolate reductase
MSKLLYSATMSLDGLIAGPGGDVSWLVDYMPPNPGVDGIGERIGAMLVGARTFSGDDPNRGTDKEGPVSGTWHGHQFVLTHRSFPPAPGVTFSDDLPAAVAAAKAAAGDKYVNVLGADVARQCLELGLIDEVLVVIAPVLLGAGTRLFSGHVTKLERISLSSTPLMTNAWFRVVHAAPSGNEGQKHIF